MQSALLLLALTTASCCVAGPIRFDFSIDSTQYLRTATGPRPEERRTTLGGAVVVDPEGARWLIRFPALGNVDEIHYCDGTNVVKYTVVLHRHGVHLEGLGGARVASLPQDGGPVGMVVSPGLHPADSYPANLVWMAWCSAAYLKSLGRTVPSPVQSIREDLTAYGYSDRTETFPDAFGLPRRLELFASHEKLKGSPLAPTIGREVPNPARMQAAFAPRIVIRDGGLHLRYTAKESTTVGGMALTTRFSFEAFEPRADTQEVRTVSAEGRIVGEPGPGSFDLPEAIRAHRNFGVVDHRFRHEHKAVDFIQYGQESPDVREKSDAELTALYARKLHTAGDDPVLQAKRLARWMWGLGLVVPVVAAWVWWKRRGCRMARG